MIENNPHTSIYSIFCNIAFSEWTHSIPCSIGYNLIYSFGGNRRQQYGLQSMAMEMARICNFHIEWEVGNMRTQMNSWNAHNKYLAQHLIASRANSAYSLADQCCRISP